MSVCLLPYTYTKSRCPEKTHVCSFFNLKSHGEKICDLCFPEVVSRIVIHTRTRRSRRRRVEKKRKKTESSLIYFKLAYVYNDFVTDFMRTATCVTRNVQIFRLCYWKIIVIKTTLSFLNVYIYNRNASKFVVASKMKSIVCGYRGKITCWIQQYITAASGAFGPPGFA